MCWSPPPLCYKGLLWAARVILGLAIGAMHLQLGGSATCESESQYTDCIAAVETCTHLAISGCTGTLPLEITTLSELTYL
ncbi:hypothetical protein CYMTET_28422 [Cymbomonas tetramitiformis]|uniref:Uncharacterized protein n=1 Tax=Cymbomonas tetramitiformis TaxID=36881 RepID=A0AAE0FN05_9CHLO|nr:hypothetical protein CYMTET_28422 [Cymbomonas tetramitiformis]